MDNHYLFTKIKPQDIQQIIDDKKLEYPKDSKRIWDNETCCEFIFVADANEIGNFCFPISSNATLDSESLSLLIDSQIAYHDIFFLHKNKPLIFNEYFHEVESMANYFNSISQSLFSDNLYFSNYFENILNVYYKKGIELTTDKDLKINLMLGLIAFGANRLDTVIKNIVKESDPIYKERLKPINNWRPGIIEDKVLTECSIKVKEALKPTLLRDIHVISKIIRLNNYYENRYLKNEINNRIIFLYFSSADKRTQQILKCFKKYNIFCKIENNEFNPWRTPIQIFQYLINRVIIDKKSKSDPSLLIDLENTNKNLGQMHLALRDLTLLKRKSNNAPNFIKSKILDIYEKSKKDYLKDLRKFENISLDNRLLPYYELDEKLMKRKVDENLENKQFREALLEIVSTRQPSIFSVDKIVQLRNLIQINHSLNEILPTPSRSNNRDIVTNIFDTFPFNIKLSSQDYQEMLNKLIIFWKEYYFKTSEGDKYGINYQLFLDIIERFIAKQHDNNYIIDEHEIIRTLLLLVNPNEKSDSDTLERIQVLFELDPGRFKDNIEFVYIYIWVLRRNKMYDDAINYCRSYMQFANDYRIGYGFALAVVAYLLDERISRLDTGIKLAEQAIQELEKTNNSTWFNPLLEEYRRPSLNSNIIYLKSYVALHTKNKAKLIEAEKTLVELKYMVSKEKWYTYFPDFLHAEVYFEFVSLKLWHTFKLKIKSPATSWENRLESAIRDIQVAKKKVNFEKEQIYNRLYLELLELQRSF